MFASDPLATAYVAPKNPAHMSAFSFKGLELSNQALMSGSVVASSSSWAMVEIMPSTPVSPLGLTLRLDGAMQPVGQRSGLPTKANRTSGPPNQFKWSHVCQPQKVL